MIKDPVAGIFIEETIVGVHDPIVRIESLYYVTDSLSIHDVEGEAASSRVDDIKWLLTTGVKSKPYETITSGPVTQSRFLIVAGNRVKDVYFSVYVEYDRGIPLVDSEGFRIQPFIILNEPSKATQIPALYLCTGAEHKGQVQFGRHTTSFGITPQGCLETIRSQTNQICRILPVGPLVYMEKMAFAKKVEGQWDYVDGIKDFFKPFYVGTDRESVWKEWKPLGTDVLTWFIVRANVDFERGLLEQ